MVTKGNDAQRKARQLMREYGKDAKKVAQRRMMELTKKNDAKAAGLWLAVMHEIHKTEKEHTG